MRGIDRIGMEMFDPDESVAIQVVAGALAGGARGLE